MAGATAVDPGLPVDGAALPVDRGQRGYRKTRPAQRTMARAAAGTRSDAGDDPRGDHARHEYRDDFRGHLHALHRRVIP
jgi:hypothetical protein